MPFCYERDFFISVVHLLMAGDVSARFVPVAESFAVEVTLDDMSKVVWSNATAKKWAYTRVLPSGDQDIFTSDLPWDSPPEGVARLIATHDYGESLAE